MIERGKTLKQCSMAIGKLGDGCMWIEEKPPTAFNAMETFLVGWGLGLARWNCCLPLARETRSLPPNTTYSTIFFRQELHC